jgi:hypothetical protein
VRDEAMHRLGIGTMHDMHSVVTGLFVPSLQFREYSIGDKLTFWRSKRAAGVSYLWDAVMATDLTRRVTTLDVPVYFLHGIDDYTASYTLAKEYFARLQAPVKGFYTFEHSAHSPNFEEPEKTLEILREDVLNRAVRLADATYGKRGSSARRRGDARQAGQARDRLQVELLDRTSGQLRGSDRADAAVRKSGPADTRSQGGS